MSEDNPYNPSKILSWAEEDRPREKLLLKGKAALSNAELIAILIGSGTVKLSAVDVAKGIMNAVNNNISELARQGMKDLMKNKGIGEAKAVTILAALELGRRRTDHIPNKRRIINGSQAVYDEMRQHLLDKSHEEFWIIMLNRANEVMKSVAVSIGGISGTVCDPKMVFKHALEHMASSIILVHNHPSGQLKASELDLNLTQQLKECGMLLDLPVLDHIIFTDKGYLSFVDEKIF
ncbi:RadC family protein [Dyadobacter frigoris]|uniref:DNA repair protein RadC n=1 Tax=Dyadobacter frigoris TaxID=2576211 RepID=A0A4U6DED7_9BACT|nr:DNA repair protein RadC [Dyadobacter frigoris]TKT92864.1 DNA repair protein RadC [Dyadobacter frigoris]GLU54362.1 DNA repair protein RadC [Dyadobacter frigoris]